MVGSHMLLPIVSMLFLIIAITLFLIAARQRHQSGLPQGRVIYTDTSRWGKVQKPLFDPTIRLTGKPDYLVEQKKQVIPVEIKSTRGLKIPYDAHIYQLAAYCLLVQHEYGVRPDLGIIHYPDHSYEIDFTARLEDTVRSIIREMQQKTRASQVNRSHEEYSRCKHCGYHSMCDQALRI